MFDKSERNSFEHIDDWINEVEKYAGKNSVKILVGSKSDMDHRVSYEEGMSKAFTYDMSYIQASAKADFQIDKIFETLVSKLLEKSGCSKNKALKIGIGKKTPTRCCRV